MSDWLLHTLLATSELTLVVLILREPVRKLFGSRVAYGLWLIPLARLFMPTLTETVERSVPAATPFPLVASEPVWMAHIAVPPPTLFERAGGWPALLLVIWLTGAAGLFLSRMIAFYRDRGAMLRSSTGAMRVGAVRLVRTPDISSPVALGILKPIIAVPSDFRRLYDRRERRLVLEHELAHHRSGDLVANLFAFVLLCLQWFNPLAWVAHAAFRFDQEAACDARVLDEAAAIDRASYGRAIAIAASGRALLFASALDRPTSLQRRLKSMLHNPSPARRVAGRLLIVTAAAAALPLTASHAVEYVDIPRPAAALAPSVRAVPAAGVAHAAIAVSAAAAPVAAARPAQAAAPLPPARELDFDRNMTINEEQVTIDGKTKRWEELTPAERARVEAAVAKARNALANSHFDQAKMMRDLANIPDKARIEQMRRDLAAARGKMAESVRKMDEDISRVRASGRPADQLEAAISESLASLRDVDFEGASRALAGIDREKIAAEVAGAQQSMERAKAELARIQAKIDADRGH